MLSFTLSDSLKTFPDRYNYDARWINQASGEPMHSTLPPGYLLIAAIIGTALLCGVATAGTLTYTIGDRVPLNGTAYATNTLYIFVTGPGLDPNGVNPAHMKSPVVSGDPSTFVQVDVTDDRWSYIWNTAHQGFSLKEGTYTLYAVNQPVAKNALPAVYGSIDISLSRYWESFPAFGTINVTTSPPGAWIYVDNQFTGVTPRSFAAVPGTHALRIESPGYQTIVESLAVNSDTVITVEKILVPVATLTATATVHPLTHVTLTTLPMVPEGTVTQTIPLTAGTGIFALSVAVLLRYSNRKK
jgi:PEGA domain